LQDGGVLTRTARPDAEQLAQVRALADEVVAHDGGRLKLELAHLATTPAQAALAHEDGRLVGFAAVYAFGGAEPELAGMVAPTARRRGLGSALLDALLPPGSGSALLVVPAGTPAGRAFALAHGATHAHSEHFLVLGETPPEPPAAGIELRPATGDDLPALGRVLAAAFGEPAHEVRLDRPGDTTYVIERSGALVGTVRLSVEDGWGGVYGFAVHPAEQGKGTGRHVLARVCRMLRADGRDRVTLEVETQNDQALRLYTSSGFVREAGEDYWRVVR
jgi:ribosomal protein S18 acetylase RimI-like enzyme